MAKLYTYMIGIEPKYWTKDDDYACENYDIKNKGYYQLGNNEGMILVGKLNDLKNIMDEYFGLEIVDEYLCPYESFDWEDGEWITGGWKESKKSAKKSIKESRETFKFNLPNNKEVISFLKPMEYGLTSAQLMTNTLGNWAMIEDPIFEESGYMYIKNKQSTGYFQYDFAKVINVDVDWGNHQIYFYTKGDVLMLHFYHLSDEEFKFLIYGDDHLDGLATRFGK